MFPSGDIQRKRLRKESENDKHAVASYGISPEKAYILPLLPLACFRFCKILAALSSYRADDSSFCCLPKRSMEVKVKALCSPSPFNSNLSLIQSF